MHLQVVAIFATGLLAASNPKPAGEPSATAAAKPAVPLPNTSGFSTVVKPLIAKSCLPCHNDRLASGSLNLAHFSAVSSLHEQRDEWERVIRKMRTGEMPPKGFPKPPRSEIDAVLSFVNGEFERADRNVKADPGRVTARRLNRTEYANTVRDLLGVDFQADKNFPTDDSGEGFDNIADILSISPVLMEKYIEAAERIAARALGADPLPKKPVEAEYALKNKTIRRIDLSTIEASHRVDFDAEYLVRIGLPGQRAEDAQPVSMGFWMDGKLLHTMPVETKPSKLVYFNPYSEEEFRIYLPEGDHVFQVGFINDEFVKGMSEKEAYSDKKNKFINSIKFIGPFASSLEKSSRKKILVCDALSGEACVNRIVSTLTRRAYRRPVTRAESAFLSQFVKMARADGLSVEQGIQLAIQAMLVSPHFLFRIERDANPKDPSQIHRVSDIELASRLSYFLWSSMPDDELLGLAESGKLRAAGVLNAQIKRMLADDRAAALSDNFAGQWLETRNLGSVKPDPTKFASWGPELRDAMQTETRLFFEAMLRENRPIPEFLDAKFTFLNERLATHYGITGVNGPDFRRVELTTEQRGGILSHASVLTVSSYPTRTSPAIRGKYVLQNILGSAPPPPPPDVPTLDEEAVGNTGSLRQQLEKHRSNTVCASCHSRMDVLGFGLENYDAIGRWRAKDGNFDIDASGTFPNGKSFQTPAEMRILLKDEAPEFARAFTEKMMTYALGRGIQRFDRRTIDDVNRKLAASGYKFQTLIYEVVHSLPFQARRGEALSSTQAEKSKEIARR